MCSLLYSFILGKIWMSYPEKVTVNSFNGNKHDKHQQKNFQEGLDKKVYDIKNKVFQFAKEFLNTFDMFCFLHYHNQYSIDNSKKGFAHIFIQAYKMAFWFEMVNQSPNADYSFLSKFTKNILNEVLEANRRC